MKMSGNGTQNIYGKNQSVRATFEKKDGNERQQTKSSRLLLTQQAMSTN